MNDSRPALEVAPEITIRLARLADVDTMRRIERAAGALFAEIGMHGVAGDEPLPRENLAEYVLDGRAWMAEVAGRSAGYALADRVDGCGHLEQVSVRPRFGRRGIGRALIEAVKAWAREEGLPALTLRTFRDVPWNGPYYAKLGFRALDDVALTPGLHALREQEAAHGLDPEARQAMRLDLDGGAGTPSRPRSR